MHFPTADVRIPNEVVIFEGGIQIFTCSSTPGTRVVWLVNGTLLEEPYPMGVTSGETITSNITIGGNLIFNNIPLDYNGTTVQCMYSNVRGNVGTSTR